LARAHNSEYTHSVRSVIEYLRTHRLQRRLLTLSVAILGGLAAGVLVYPRISNMLLIRQLAERDENLRARAILRGVSVARRSEEFTQRLEEALSTGDDVQFAAVVSVLRRVGRFEIPRRDPLHIDRMRALDLAQTRSDDDPRSAARTREIIASKVLLTGRRNPYVAKAAASALQDDSPRVRRIGALLGAIYPNDEALRVLLLTDRDQSVLSAAALAAGIAGRKALSRELLTLFASAGDSGVVSSAGFALSLLDAKAHSPEICRKLRETDDEALRDRLLHVTTILADENARSVVAEIISTSLERGELPPAGATTAAGKLNLPGARAAVLAVLSELSKPERAVRESQVIAAFETARALKMDVRREATEFCRAYWGPDFPRALIAATKAASAGLRDVPDGEVAQVLRAAATFSVPSPSQPAAGPAVWVTTPVPSAAAAVALWRMGVPGAADLIKQAIAVEDALPGEYVAWELGTGENEGAFELAVGLLPSGRPSPADGEPSERVYNENVLAAGAMLLALSAGTPEQIALGIQRIEDRLNRTPRDFYLEGTYRCALLILGRSDQLRKVRQLLGSNQFPQRRVLTALLATADRYALDWLLFPGQDRDEYVARLVLDEGFGDVLRACAADLPFPDTCGDRELLKWQIRILRCTCALNPQGIELRLKG